MDSVTLVRDYIGRLEALASGLPADRRAELVDEVEDHIEFALAEAGHADEATVRNVLDRLGPPGDIVAAEAGAAPASTSAAVDEPPAAGSHAISTENRALLLLTLGAFLLPFVGPVLGLWVASGSARWSLAQKRTAGMIVAVLLALPVATIIPAIVSREITWVFSSASFLIPFVPLSGLVAAAYLIATSFELTVSRRRD
jgi:uncharacterized membrane protein